MKKAVVVLMALNIISCASTQTSTQGLHPLEYMNDSEMFMVEHKGKKSCFEATDIAWPINCDRLPYSVKAKIRVIDSNSNNPADYTPEEGRLLLLALQAND